MAGFFLHRPRVSILYPMKRTFYGDIGFEEEYNVKYYNKQNSEKSPLKKASKHNYPFTNSLFV